MTRFMTTWRICAGIGLDGGEVLRQMTAQQRLLGDRDVQQVDQLLHEAGEVDRLHDEPPTAGIGEHLPAELGGPAGGVLDLPQVVAARGLGRHLQQRQVGVAEDRREQVVEIVRDAAREHAEALQLLRLLHLRLELAPLLLRPVACGDVAEAPDPAHRPAVDRLRLGVAFEDPAVLELQRVEAGGLRLGVQLPHLGEESLSVLQLIQDELDRPLRRCRGSESPCAPLAERRVLGEPPHLGEAIVESHDRPFAIHHQDSIRCRFQCRPQQGHGLPEIVLGPRCAR